MEWYGPITVLPAVCLLILSTSNFIVSLNSELSELEKEKFESIIRLKVNQLKLLGVANSFLYASAILFLVAGLYKAVFINEQVFFHLLLVGVIGVVLALTILFIHSYRSVSIRQKHLKL